jgi:hypothetical protein
VCYVVGPLAFSLGGRFREPLSRRPALLLALAAHVVTDGVILLAGPGGAASDALGLVDFPAGLRAALAAQAAAYLALGLLWELLITGDSAPVRLARARWAAVFRDAGGGRPALKV